MSFNVVEIQVVTDYTDFSNTVRFHLNVPVTPDAAGAIAKALDGQAWDDVSTAITTATKASAPAPIETLVEALLAAYAGKPSTPTPPKQD